MVAAKSKTPELWRKTLLGQILDAPRVEPTIEEWRADGRALLDRVLARAARDKVFARTVVDQLARFAASSDELRKRLREEIRAAGQGKKRGGSRAIPHWQHGALLDTYEHLKAAGYSPAKVREETCFIMGISEASLANRLTRARKLVKAEDRPPIHKSSKTRVKT